MAAVIGRLRGSKNTYWKMKKTMLVFSSRHCRAKIPACLSAVSEQSSFTAESQEKDKWRWSGLLLFIPGVATFGLGTWQFFRRLKKMELIEHRQKRLEQDPVLLTSIMPETSDIQAKAKISSLEFRKVVCEGVYDESKSIYIGPRSRSVSGVTENGYYVVTPLMPVQQNGSVQIPVLVNRGWVPRSWQNKSSQNSLKATSQENITSSEKDISNGGSWWKFWLKKPANANVKDADSYCKMVKVSGVIRGSESPNIFMPLNDPDSGQWFYVDVPAIARAVGLPENALYVDKIEGAHDASNPYPVPKDASTFVRYSVMPQDHLNYALTWYTLSAATIFMAKKRLQKKKLL